MFGTFIFYGFQGYVSSGVVIVGVKVDRFINLYPYLAILFTTNSTVLYK